jgi:hypothetical protein
VGGLGERLADRRGERALVVVQCLSIVCCNAGERRGIRCGIR